MKTPERILLTSLELFNQQGEANVTCVDIAIELDISPGNLYYHFKGKEVIVAALFELYRERMDKVLISSNQEQLSVEEFFYYLLLILESSHLFRFLYRNPNDLAEKYPSVAKGFKKIIADKEKTFNQLFSCFTEQQLLNCNSAQQTKLVELIGIVFTQSLNYFQLKGLDAADDEVVYQSLETIYYALSPYFVIPQPVAEELLEAITQHQLG